MGQQVSANLGKDRWSESGLKRFTELVWFSDPRLSYQTVNTIIGVLVSALTIFAIYEMKCTIFPLYEESYKHVKACEYLRVRARAQSVNDHHSGKARSVYDRLIYGLLPQGFFRLSIIFVSIHLLMWQVGYLNTRIHHQFSKNTYDTAHCLTLTTMSCRLCVLVQYG